MSIKTYQFFCDNCGYKRFTKGDDIQDLVQVKQTSIPRGSPQIDPFTKKVVIPPSINRPKTFKCPNCGFLIKAKKLTITETTETTETTNEQTNRTDGRETGATG